MAAWVLVIFYLGLHVVVCCGRADWNSTEDWLKFVQFSKDFRKSYGSEEELWTRFAAFRASLQRHALLNRPYSTDKPVYGVNKFSDLTPSEFKGAGHSTADRGGEGRVDCVIGPQNSASPHPSCAERYLSPAVEEVRSSVHAALPTPPKDVKEAFDWSVPRPYPLSQLLTCGPSLLCPGARRTKSLR